jgi:hypothetical protein
MPKCAISVTLGQNNLLWLRTQAEAARRRSVSETLDELVSEARLAGRVREESVRSVVGTIDIGADDPLLEAADAVVRARFDESIARPPMVREPRRMRPRVRHRG